MFPFSQKVISCLSQTKVVHRTFSKDTPPEELVWHMDDEDRTITPLNPTDWLFQFDNELPIPIEGNIRIPKHEIHRIIKGTGDLDLKITMYK